MSRELGLASVMITHDVDEAALMADRVYVLVGDPAAGVPTQVGTQIEVTRVTEGDFSLTEEFLEAKRAITAALAG